MPFALVAIGLLLIIAAYNNTQSVLSSQLQKDFVGAGSFTYWIAAIIIVGAIGYIKPLETISRAFLALIIVVMFLSNEGMFQKFTDALGGSSATNDGETK